MAGIEQVRSIQDMFIEELETEAKSKDKVALILENLESESEAEDEEEQARTSEPSLEDLHKKAVLFVSKECSDESDRVSQRIQLEGAPDGFQNTGTSYTMYKVLDSELRKAKGNFNRLLALTVAFKDEDYCFHDTDIPDVAKKLVSRWAKLWQDALSHGLPLDDRSVEGVMYMLSKLKRLFEEEMDIDYSFAFEPKRQQVLKDGPATPSKRKLNQEPNSGAKRSRTKLSLDLEQRLHREDAQLKEAQDCAIQVVCREEGKKTSAVRAIVVSGAHPVKSLIKTIGAAFTMEGTVFDHHPNKGTAPKMRCLLDGQELPATLKLFQVFQAGGVVTLEALERRFTCKLDGIVSNKAACKNRCHLPRCVGTDAKSLGKVGQLNKLFMGDRQPGNYLCSTKAQAKQATLKDMGRPLIIDGVVVSGMNRFGVEPLVL